jgi:hypothetical protein
VFRTLLTASSVMWLTASLGGQPTALNGPVEGFAFDIPSSSFRPVIGVPGSASLGSRVFSEAALGSVAPRLDYALVFQKGQYILVTGLSSNRPSPQTIARDAPQPEGVVWSGDGTVAVLYSKADNWVRLLGGLPGAPTLGPIVYLSSLNGTLVSIAVHPHGASLAVGLSGPGAGVYQLQGGSFLLVSAASNPISLSFSLDGAFLYVLDMASVQISRIQMVNFTSESWPIQGLVDPFAISAAAGPASVEVLYVAGRNDRVLQTYDPVSHNILGSLSLPFEPSIIAPLGRTSFLLRDRFLESDPLWCLQTTPTQAVYFIPATPLNVKPGREKGNAVP